MFCSGTTAQQQSEWAALLEGYEQFAHFDAAEAGLIESLRGMRMLNHAAWLASRWDDPAFPARLSLVRRAALLGTTYCRVAGTAGGGGRSTAVAHDRMRPGADVMKIGLSLAGPAVDGGLRPGPGVDRGQAGRIAGRAGCHRRRRIGGRSGSGRLFPPGHAAFRAGGQAQGRCDLAPAAGILGSRASGGRHCSASRVRNWASMPAAPRRRST